MASCKECIHYGICIWTQVNTEKKKVCKDFKSKADFVEVVRCGKCKHGDVSIMSKTKDGEETIACYCNAKNKVTDLEYYCACGERRDT